MARCSRCRRDLPSRPGRHLHGPVSHVCTTDGVPGYWDGAVFHADLFRHPVWVGPPEQDSNLFELTVS